MGQAPVDILFRLKDRATRPAQANLRKLDAGANQLKRTMLGLGAAIGGAFAVGKLAGFAKESVALANAQEKALAKVRAVVQATGGAAGFTAAELADMAGGLQAVTTAGDEAVLETQALLLTFREIKGDEFAKTTELAYDLAAVLGGDAKASAMQLGKALNDPARGLTKLQRVGVTFTDQQKEQVQALQAAGDVAGAQRVILAELEAQVGGTARALRDTFGGATTALGNSWGDLREKIGDYIAQSPAAITAVEEIVRVVDDVGAALADMGPASGDSVATLLRGFKTVGQTILGLRHVVNAVQLGFDYLAGAAVYAFDKIVGGAEQTLEALNFRGVFDAELASIRGFRGDLEDLSGGIRAHQAEQKQDIEDAQAAWVKLGEVVDGVIAKVTAAPATRAPRPGRGVGGGGAAGASGEGAPAAAASPYTQAGGDANLPGLLAPSVAFYSGGEFFGAEQAAAAAGERLARAEWQAYAAALGQLAESQPGSPYTEAGADAMFPARELEDRMDRVGAAATRAGTAITTGFGSAFAKALVQGQNFSDQMKAIFEDLASHAVSLFTQAALGTGLSLLFPGFAGPTLGGLFGFHGGGLARAHGGLNLAPGEVPAVLQSGERVLSRTQNAEYEEDLLGGAAAGGGSGGAQAVELHLDGAVLARWITQAGADGRLRSGRYSLTPELA